MDLMTSCADMIIMCGHERIPCSRFTCLSKSEVLRGLFECTLTQMETTEEGMPIVPFPAGEATAVRLAVQLLHKARDTSTLSLPEVEAARRGLDFLHSTEPLPALDQREWELVQNVTQPTKLAGHVSVLLHNKELRGLALSRLVQLAPLWRECRAAMSSVDWVFETASYALRKLVEVFPASLLLRFFLENLTGITESQALLLIGDHGVYYHPGEMAGSLALLSRMFTQRNWSAPMGALLKSVRQALHTYDPVPYSTSRCTGTVVMYHTAPTASVLLSVDAPETVRPLRCKASQWLTVSWDRSEGKVDAKLTLGKLDASANAADAQLRVMAICGVVDVVDVWYELEDINPRVPVTLSEVGTVERGSPLDLGRALRSPALEAIRLDVFYGPCSVLERPFDPVK